MWRKLRELTIGDLLVGTKEHIKITPFGNDSSTAIDNAIRLMPGEGKEQRLSDINDWENWETWEKMVGFRIKHSKLTEVANSKREHRVFTDFVENLEDYMEHVTIRHYIEPQNAAKEFGLGSEALQGGALRNIKMYIDIEIDFKSMFEDEMARDDILEGMPTSTWLPPTGQTLLRAERITTEDLRLEYTSSDYTNWNINTYEPKILIDNTGRDRTLDPAESELWDEIMGIVVEEEVPKPPVEEEDEEEDEDADISEEGFLYGTAEANVSEEEEEDVFSSDQPYINWDEVEDTSEKHWMRKLKNKHHDLIQSVTRWQTFNKLPIEEWQEDSAKHLHTKQLNEQAVAEAKKKEIVHAPRGTRSEEKRIFKEDPEPNVEPILDLWNAYNVDGSKIRQALTQALNPTQGVLLKISISGFVDEEKKSTTNYMPGNDWLDKVFGVFYLQNIEIEKKVKWGYSGVPTPKTTKGGEPSKTKGAWSQVPKPPSSSEVLGQGEDRPQMPNVLQPGTATHQIPETEDPDTGRHRMTDPDTGEYPRTEVSYGEGFQPRGRRGGLDTGGSIRGEYGQQKWVVLMGYLRKQYRKVEEMIEDA